MEGSRGRMRTPGFRDPLMADVGKGGGDKDGKRAGEGVLEVVDAEGGYGRIGGLEEQLEGVV